MYFLCRFNQFGLFFDFRISVPLYANASSFIGLVGVNFACELLFFRQPPYSYEQSIIACRLADNADWRLP